MEGGRKNTVVVTTGEREVQRVLLAHVPSLTILSLSRSNIFSLPVSPPTLFGYIILVLAFVASFKSATPPLSSPLIPSPNSITALFFLFPFPVLLHLWFLFGGRSLAGRGLILETGDGGRGGKRNWSQFGLKKKKNIFKEIFKSWRRLMFIFTPLQHFCSWSFEFRWFLLLVEIKVWSWFWPGLVLISS